MIRLQCYEGLDEAKALYEWEYSKQLLYTQILKDKRLRDDRGCRAALAEAADRVGAGRLGLLSRTGSSFRVRSCRRSRSDKPALLLIDEVDKSDPEFEAFLLEILSDFQVTIPEIGTIKAKTQPLVFLTSNDAREMSDALQATLPPPLDRLSERRTRRCSILDRKVPNIDKRLAEDVVQLMNQDPRPRPQEDAVDLGDPRLGPCAAGAQRRRPRRRDRVAIR